MADLDIRHEPDPDKRRALAEQVAMLHRDSLSTALADGFLIGARETFLVVLGESEELNGRKNWRGPLPEDFRAWCREAIRRIEKQMASKPGRLPLP